MIRLSRTSYAAIATQPKNERVLGRYLIRRARWLVLLVFVLASLFVWREGTAHRADSLPGALRAALADGGLFLERDAVHWLTPAEPGTTEALVLARETSPAGNRGARDVFRVRLRLDRSLGVLDVVGTWNMSRTASGDETQLVRAGPWLVYPTETQEGFRSLTALRFLPGEPPELTAGWSARARIQNALSNYQDHGATRGVDRVRYRFTDPPARVRLRSEANAVRVRVNRKSAPDAATTELWDLRPQHRCRAVPATMECEALTKSEPGLITWIVDRVRMVPWIGPAPIEWLEHRVFGVVDWVERQWFAWFGSSERELSAQAAEELGVVGLDQRSLTEDTAITREQWPPPPLKPILSYRIRGEGRWVSVKGDPFVATYPNSPAAFFQSFVRADPDRPYTRVYVTLWSPRQVQLHMVGGIREPESPTGEKGRGVIERTPAVLKRLVGAFNGGFQAMHGEFGMMERRRVYIPPKPWAATVAVFDDGRVGMGSWAPPPDGATRYDAIWAVDQIPRDMVSFRQNLTSLVEGKAINPWKRWWWGAAPPNSKEQTLIDRSGICITREGHMAYFWGKSLSADALALAMRSTRCVRGMHLDMNGPHTGFEFYRVQSADVGLRPLERPLDKGEFEGPFPDEPKHVYRARKMVRSMTPIRFPRYTERDGRDFFYLTLRPVLPGPNLTGQGTAQLGGAFSSAGLTQTPWPPAVVRTFIGNQAGGTWIVRIDPRRAPPEALAYTAVAKRGAADGPATGEAEVVAMLEDGPADGPLALTASRVPNGVGWTLSVGPVGVRTAQTGPIVLVRGHPPRDDGKTAVGVDTDGFIVYAESIRDPVPLTRRLTQAKVVQALDLGSAHLALPVQNNTIAPNGQPRTVKGTSALSFVFRNRPMTEVLFPDNRPLPYGRWARMQDTRVHYLRQKPPTARRPGNPAEEAP